MHNNIIYSLVRVALVNLHHHRHDIVTYIDPALLDGVENYD